MVGGKLFGQSLNQYLDKNLIDPTMTKVEGKNVDFDEYFDVVDQTPIKDADKVELYSCKKRTKG